MKLDEIILLSQKYGKDPELVLAGGGNTSIKEDGILYVKASGSTLGGATEKSFVALQIEKLLNLLDSGNPDEAEVLKRLLAARIDQTAPRPSVEALLHALFKQKFVVHLHPAAVNAVTCSKNGKAEIEALFGDNACWMDEINPGYTLAIAAYKAMKRYEKTRKKRLSLLFLQNHGVFFAADSTEEIEALIDKTMSAIREKCSIHPDLSEICFDRTAAAGIAPLIRGLTGNYVVFFTNTAIKDFVASREAAAPVMGAYTPDHIVYSGHMPCFADEDVCTAVQAYIKKYGASPKIVLVKGVGAYALGSSLSNAVLAKMLFIDTVKVAVMSGNFGGYRFLSPKRIAFIRNWEVENYRSKALSVLNNGRLGGKIAVVTGGAQGFGAGLAESLCKNGACTVIADINIQGAEAFAAELCDKYGKGKALAVKCDVGSEDSVKTLCESTALTYGGIDLFVSNAGILRSGGLEDMDFETFELMTKINYEAFFLCTRYASRVMKAEHSRAPGKSFDIIQINSKSGLSGSNKNFAYAGGKFGGIGLVQSFALELAPCNIKVNAICPGNFLDGPLWADPEKGFFVQYLRAGKVPGAKTTADVRRYYESKVPLGRGCTPDDVFTALCYVVEQQYETGQAVPVTGGQNMLK